MAWNLEMYSRSIIEASKSVLVELLRCLGMYKQHLVLVGGWAPYFILERFGRERRHCGSIDVDFALNPALIDKEVYMTIVETIKRRGYASHVDELGNEVPFRFFRSVMSPFDNKEYKIEVDFLTEPETVSILHRPLLQVQRDLQAIIMPGCGVVFHHNFAHKIEGVLPDNGLASVSVKVADVTGILTMKGLALEGRYKEKDPYDIYSVVKFFKRGPTGAALQVRRHLKEPIVGKALEVIKEKFKTLKSEGPFQVSRFMAPTKEEERTRIQAEVYTTMKRFVEKLK
ncbi:hypothetical protein IBX38_01450 [Candidatus Bathyarchaeota archaeon]|nr:hypothetical protein [Candidatus Bathyarchaeota archaeon]